jgi:hypothetical protein
MRICYFCEKETDEIDDEHHVVPKALNAKFDIVKNVDLFRIILCKKCHKKMNEIWKPILQENNIWRDWE